MRDDRQLAELNLRERWEREQRWQLEDPAYEEWLNEYEQETNSENSEHHGRRQRRERIQETSSGCALRDLQHDGGLRDAAGIPGQAATEGVHPLGGS